MAASRKVASEGEQIRMISEGIDSLPESSAVERISGVTEALKDITGKATELSNRAKMAADAGARLGGCSRASRCVGMSGYSWHARDARQVGAEITGGPPLRRTRTVEGNGGPRSSATANGRPPKGATFEQAELGQ